MCTWSSNKLLVIQYAPLSQPIVVNMKLKKAMVFTFNPFYFLVFLIGWFSNCCWIAWSTLWIRLDSYGCWETEFVVVKLDRLKTILDNWPRAVLLIWEKMRFLSILTFIRLSFFSHQVELIWPWIFFFKTYFNRWLSGYTDHSDCR